MPLVPSRLKLAAGKTLGSLRDFPRDWRAAAACPSGRPILVTGAHRSGTTWVGRMLTEPGLWHYHEPFNPNVGLWPRQFCYRRREESDAEADRLMRALLRGRCRKALLHPHVEYPVMPCRWAPLPVRRVMIKDPTACLMSEYLTTRFGMATLVVFRHPAGFAASLKRLGWPCAPLIRQLLGDERLMSDWLEPWRGPMEAVDGREGVGTAALLHGCLTVVLWGFCRRTERMRALVYEELCADPLPRFRQLQEELGLPCGPETERRQRELCTGGGGQAAPERPHGVRRASGSMATRWRGELASDELRVVRETWDLFATPLYRDAGDW